MRINFPAIYSTIIAIGLLLALAVPAPIFANNFYGIKSLNPMVTGGEMTFYLPGGTQLAVGNETEYSLTDHLHSTRLAIKTDNMASEPINYTPFGDNPTTGSNNHYTGMTYEPETATYDYHARNYDGSTARFTAVDAIRQSISPYSYTENDPINHVDPDGLGRLNFWFFLANEDDRKYMLNVSSAMVGSDRNSFVLDKYDSPRAVKHSELSNPDSSIGQLNLDIDRSILSKYSGEEFASYFYDRFNARYPSAVGKVESILLHGCSLACQSEAGGKSFGRDFFNRISSLGFDNLKSVYASNYDIRAYSERGSNFFTLDVLSNDVKPGAKLRGFLRFKISIKDYYSGNLSPILKNPLEANPFRNPFTVMARPRGRGEEHTVKLTDHEQIKTFMAENGYGKPVFRNVRSRPPVPVPADGASASARDYEVPIVTRTRLETLSDVKFDLPSVKPVKGVFDWI